MTRWSTIDLTAKLIKRMSEDSADQWEVLELPAILDSGEPLWPEYWKIEELEAVKASIPVAKWNAQYMQNPTSEEGAIVRREWWNIWEDEEPPPVDYIIQSYDTAFSKKEAAQVWWCVESFLAYEMQGDAVGLPEHETPGEGVPLAHCGADGILRGARGGRHAGEESWRETDVCQNTPHTAKIKASSPPSRRGVWI